GGGRGGVEVVVALLDVLAVVALRPGQAEGALLEDGVIAVPQGGGEAQPALAVGDAEQAVLAPAVGAGVGVLEREVPPAGAGGGVVLADGGPLAGGQVRPPPGPVPHPPGVLGEADGLGVCQVGRDEDAGHRGRVRVGAGDGGCPIIRHAAATDDAGSPRPEG